MSTRHDDGTGTRPVLGDLARLIDAESRLESVLAQAREEAAAILAAARSAARSAEVVLETELAQSEGARAGEIEAECRRQAAQVRALGRQRADALHQLPEDRVRELATQVIDRLIRGADP